MVTQGPTIRCRMRFLTLLAAPPVDEAGWGQKESGAQGTMPVQAPLIQCHCYAMYSSC